MKHLLLFLALCIPASAANYYLVTQPLTIFNDANGNPLSNGYVYFGSINQNPITNPITMTWDAAGTIPAVQPLRTINGYISRQGTPANIYAPSAYSVTVQNQFGSLVFNNPNSLVQSPAAASGIALVDAGNYYSGNENVESAFQVLGPLITQMVTALANNVPTGARIGYVGATAPVGWVFGSGQTIGDASSGATSATHQRANADTQALFFLLWNSYTNTELVIQTSGGAPTTRGASASVDFSINHCRMPTPDYRARVAAGLDGANGSTTTSRLTAAGLGAAQVATTRGAASTGATGFTETHAMTLGELASHTHTVTDPGHNHTQNAHQHTGVIVSTTSLATYQTAGGSQGIQSATSGSTANFTAVNIANTTGITNVAAGSNTPFSVVQPTIIETFIIKL